MMEASPLNLRRAVIWIGRLVFAGIFMYAGYAKLFPSELHPLAALCAAFFAFHQPLEFRRAGGIV